MGGRTVRPRGRQCNATPKIARVPADVVISTWKARDLLERCLSALRSDPSEKTVIVVDNASEDGTIELVRSGSPR